MRRNLITLTLILLSSFIRGIEPDSRGYIVAVGDTCPDFTLTFPDSSEITRDELKDKVFMLQFTASWCSVCRKEMPHIENEIWQKHKDGGLVVIGVDRDEPAETVRKFAKAMNITYPLALDPGANIFAKFALKESGVTRNVVVDQQGKIIFLSRLFDPKEFEEMKIVIHNTLTPSNIQK
ncbi:MAG: TlpA family protein disulfide reductase [Candidatus Marinimicrobia bacterium]|nr:TlpA family protein disulfide reductase [Candidatus Neomarinimicrobiota bacterium]MBL7059538.1 TlpA family protein disulfide reductase [Candidatus Neomarinimicrobiota bacterium]